MTIGILSDSWSPLGLQSGIVSNYIFVIVLLSLILLALWSVVKYYETILRWCLQNKGTFLMLPVITIMLGLVIWLGFPKIFGFVPKTFDKIGWNVRTTSVWSGLAHTFPGVGKEFMPSLNEGSFLLMPTAMPHVGVAESKRILSTIGYGNYSNTRSGSFCWEIGKSRKCA